MFITKLFFPEPSFPLATDLQQPDLEEYIRLVTGKRLKSEEEFQTSIVSDYNVGFVYGNLKTCKIVIFFNSDLPEMHVEDKIKSGSKIGQIYRTSLPPVSVYEAYLRRFICIKKELLEALERVKAYFQVENLNKFEVICGGYSVGGALAFISTLFFTSEVIPDFTTKSDVQNRRNRFKCITFGCPEVLIQDSKSKIELDEHNFLRFYNSKDYVPSAAPNATELNPSHFGIAIELDFHIWRSHILIPRVIERLIMNLNVKQYARYTLRALRSTTA